MQRSSRYDDRARLLAQLPSARRREAVHRRGVALPLHDVPEPDTSSQRPAGLYHHAKTDTVELRLFAGKQPPSPLSSVLARTASDAVSLRLGWGADGRLYRIVVLGASQAIPAGVLRGQAGPTPPPGPLSKEPDDWFLPLFDGAELVTRQRVTVLDGSLHPRVSVMLAASGRIAGFVVIDAARHLPEAMIGR